MERRDSRNIPPNVDSTPRDNVDEVKSRRPAESAPKVLTLQQEMQMFYESGVGGVRAGVTW